MLTSPLLVLGPTYLLFHDIKCKHENEDVLDIKNLSNELSLGLCINILNISRLDIKQNQMNSATTPCNIRHHLLLLVGCMLMNLENDCCIHTSINVDVKLCADCPKDAPCGTLYIVLLPIMCLFVPCLLCVLPKINYWIETK